MKQVLVKAIKGADNPADLGTKALSRDKIKKYLRTLGYRDDFVNEQETQVRRTSNAKMISIGMMAEIIAILASDEFTVEAAKVGIKHSTSCAVGLCLLVLVCVAISFVTIMCPSAAVLAQAGGFGQESRKEKKRKREGKERVADESRKEMQQELEKEAAAPSTELQPTAAGSAIRGIARDGA